MPGFDRRGPLGEGPLTGGGRGRCNGDGRMNMGWGNRMRGNGRGRGFWKTEPEPMSAESNNTSMESLRRENEYLRSLLLELESKLKERNK